MEILSNKFNSLISQYQETYRDFINTINSNNNLLITNPESAYLSENNIDIIKNSSVENCKTSCQSNKSCSGATFNNTLNTCSLNSGNGHIVRSSNETAIVKQALFYSYKLENLNNELININKNMINSIKDNVDNYELSKNINLQKSEIIKNNYNTLVNERNQIAEIIRQYETLNSAYENGNLSLTSNYYNYILYMIIVIILIIILLNINTQLSDNNFVTNKLIFTILLIIGLIYIFKN